MANAIKYQSEFQDLTGQQWRINIHDQLFGGTTPTTFTLGGSGFVLSYKGDTENVFQSIIGSSVQFEFIEETAAHTAFIDSLATAAESRFTLTIEKLVAGSYELEWTGVILSDQWTKMNEPLPRSSMLTASDDIGNLKTIAYKATPSVAYTGTLTLKNHLINALTKTRALHAFDTNDVFLRVADDFVAVNHGPTSRFLEYIRTHHESFWNVDDDGQRAFMNAFDVIKSIAQSQNARVFLSGGVWYFVPIGALQNTTSVVFHSYTKGGVYLSTETAVDVSLPVGTDLIELAGNETRFTPPLSEARRARDYNGNAPVIWAPYIAQNNFTTAITDFGVDYFTGQLINLVGTVNVTLPGVDPAFGASDASDRTGRIAVNVQFKCGNQYAVAPVTFGGQGNFGFDDGTVGTYDLANYGTLAWTGTAGSTAFLSEPFDRNAGTSQTIGCVFTTDALPSPQTSLEIVLSINLVEHDGTFVAIDAGLNPADSPAYFGQNFRAYRADVDGGGSEITYTAFGDDSNRAIKIDDTVILGDRIGDADRGVLEVFTGSGWADSTGWNSTNYTGTAVGINRLAVAEIMRTMRNPMPIFAGSMHVGDPVTIGSLVAFLNVLDFDGDTFLFTEFTMRVNDRILEFEVTRIDRDTTTITETTGDKKNINGDVVPGGFNPLNDQNGLSNAIGSTQTDITSIQQKTNLITVTQLVDLDDMESDIGTNATNISGITGILSVLKETFQPKGDDGNAITKVVYENGKTDGLEMTLSPTTAAFTSNSGNSQMSITESSPGVFRVDLQDDSTPVNSVPTIYATASGRAPVVGINTTTPSHELEVAGHIGVTGNIEMDGSLVIGGDVYAFKYLTSNFGLFFNLTNPGFEFRNGSGTAIFRVHAGNGEMTIANAYTMPLVDGSANQILKTDGSGNVDFFTLTLDDISDVDTTTTPPTNGDVLTWDNSAAKWVPDTGGGSGGGGSHSFSTIAVAGQTDVVADSGNDTLTLAAGTNAVITTNATTDTITLAVSSTPTFTSLLTTGDISSIGNIFTSGAITGSSGTITNGFTVNGTFSSNTAIIGAGGLTFTGGGTTIISPENNLPNTPNDLEIRSNGNVVVVLDVDDDETNQYFEVQNGDGTTILKVDENGISSGFFTSTTPIIATISNFESTQNGTVTVTNYDSNVSYEIKLFDNAGTEQTAQTITNNNDGTWTITNGPILTGAYITARAVEFGQLVSATATSNRFDITAAATQQRYWRLQLTDANKNPVKSKVALGNFRLYTQTGGGGTAYPSNMTSATAPAPFVASAGYNYSSSYAEWRAFDANIGAAGSMWWTLGNNSAANNWIQIDLGSSIDLGGGECQIRTSGGWTDANFAVLYGSNTGNFTGEEREMAFFQNIDKAGESGGTFTTYTQPIS